MSPRLNMTCCSDPILPASYRGANYLMQTERTTEAAPKQAPCTNRQITMMKMLPVSNRKVAASAIQAIISRLYRGEYLLMSIWLKQLPKIPPIGMQKESSPCIMVGSDSMANILMVSVKVMVLRYAMKYPEMKDDKQALRTTLKMKPSDFHFSIFWGVVIKQQNLALILYL